jgi:hypothetical protein
MQILLSLVVALRQEDLLMYGDTFFPLTRQNARMSLAHPSGLYSWQVLADLCLLICKF